MFKRISLAFLAGTAGLGAGLHQAVAIEAAAPFAEPTVIYADQPVQRPAASRKQRALSRSSRTISSRPAMNRGVRCCRRPSRSR
jgi:hypothetical protein